MQAIQRLNEFKRFVILLFDDNASVYDQGERVNSFLAEEFKEDCQSVVFLDIDGDDFELEMEKSISQQSQSMNERQRDYKNWYKAL